MAITITTLNAGAFTFNYTSSPSGSGGTEDAPLTSLFNYSGEDGRTINSVIAQALPEEISEGYATSVNGCAFANCTTLKNLELRNVVTIGSSAFVDCNELRTINLPKATSIGEDAFENCASLTTIGLGSIDKAAVIGNASTWGIDLSASTPARTFNCLDGDVETPLSLSSSSIEV